MPIFDILSVGDEPLPPDTVQRLADALGQALELPPGRVWVRCQILPPAGYAESGGADRARPPVFVTVLHAHPPEGADRRAEMARLTACVAATLARDADRVHLEYAPAGAGRMAFGGTPVA